MESPLCIGGHGLTVFADGAGDPGEAPGWRGNRQWRSAPGIRLEQPARPVMPAFPFGTRDDLRYGGTPHARREEQE